MEYEELLTIQDNHWRATAIVDHQAWFGIEYTQEMQK